MAFLKDKIQRGEGLTQDFKFCIDDQKKIARTLVAFANTSGGSLLIGVKDNGKIVGVDPEEEYYMIEGASAHYCIPPVAFESKVWQEDRHLVLEIEVAPSSVRHKAINEEGKYQTWYRVDDNTVSGNKILDKVWWYRNHGLERPEKFNDETLNFIRELERAQPARLSKLYKVSGLGKSHVDKLLATLIYWDIISYRLIDDGIYYYIRG